MSTSDHAGAAAEDDPPPEDPRFRVMRRLVTYLLVVLIAGTLSVVIALLLKLKEVDFDSEPTVGVVGVGAAERLVGAEATADRITLMIEDAESGARRLVILDATTFEVVGAVAAETTNED